MPHHGAFNAGHPKLRVNTDRHLARIAHCLVFFAALAWSSGALSLSRAEARAASDALALRQHEVAQQLASATVGRRLWFAGFAMNSTSTAFQGDLELVSKVLAGLGGPVLRYEHSNPPRRRVLRYPLATPGALAETLRRIAPQTRAGDVVVVLISSHGNSQVISVNVAQKEVAPLTASELAKALEPLGDTPTVVLLSACYSGSFIPELARDTRIILTAAAADRPSYGCQVESRNTFFIEELFGPDFDSSLSLWQLAAQGHARIARHEHELKLEPSDPQISIGSKVRALAERPLKAWFQP